MFKELNPAVRNHQGEAASQNLHPALQRPERTDARRPHPCAQVCPPRWPSGDTHLGYPSPEPERPPRPAPEPPSPTRAPPTPPAPAARRRAGGRRRRASSERRLRSAATRRADGLGGPGQVSASRRRGSGRHPGGVPGLYALEPRVVREPEVVPRRSHAYPRETAPGVPEPTRIERSTRPLGAAATEDSDAPLCVRAAENWGLGEGRSHVQAGRLPLPVSRCPRLLTEAAGYLSGSWHGVGGGWGALAHLRKASISHPVGASGGGSPCGPH